LRARNAVNQFVADNLPTDDRARIFSTAKIKGT
jgi:hypothetical protein